MSDTRVLKPFYLIHIDVISLFRSLDRTNIVQDIMSRMILEEYLDREGIDLKEVWTHHRELWVKNGDDLSRIYAGTGALHTSFTRTGRRTLAGTRHFPLVLPLPSFIPGGFLSRATKTVSRAYINNFQDDGKQFAIDMLLVRLCSYAGNQITKTSTLQGNIKNQLQVTIDYAIDDSVRTTLGQLYISLTIPMVSSPGPLTRDFRSAEYSTSTQSSVLPWLPPRPSEQNQDLLK